MLELRRIVAWTTALVLMPAHLSALEAYVSNEKDNTISVVDVS